MSGMNGSSRSLVPAIQELERLFQFFAKRLPWGREMHRPVIVILPAGRKNALGWFVKSAWKVREENGKSETVAEINLSAEFLDRSGDQIAATLIHEMVHLCNGLDGVKDCNTNQYHNGKFKAVCDRIGLVCQKREGQERFGWAFTQLIGETERAVEEARVNISVFHQRLSGDNDQKKSETRMKKWTCGCTIVRCATELDAECSACGGRFVTEDQGQSGDS